MPASLQPLKEDLGITVTDFDSRLQNNLDSAKIWIQNHINRNFDDLSEDEDMLASEVQIILAKNYYNDITEIPEIVPQLLAPLVSLGITPGTSTSTPSGPGGPAVDQVARDAARAAQNTADVANQKADTNKVQRERLANTVQDVSDKADENEAKLVTPSDAEADAATSNTVRGWAAAKIRRVVEAIVPAWARQVDPPTGGGSQGGGSFDPSKINLFEGVKAIFHPDTNSGITADDTNKELDLTLPEQRVVVDVPASNDTIDKIILENGEAYTTVERVIHQATPNQATYDSIRFDLGYFGDESALSATFYRVGRFYYNFTKHTPRVVAYISGNSGPKHWIDGDAGTLVSNIQDDVGYYASDNEATPHVTEVGDVYYNERLRTYRRVKTFTAGTGPVSAPRRQRQANEDDLAALHDQITVNSRNALDLVVVPSPTILDLNNFPESIHVNVRVAINKFDGTSMRINVLGKTVNITSTTTPSYQNDKKIYRIDVPVDSQMQANARAATVGPSAVDYTEVNVSILGGSLGNTELASTIFRMAIFETKDQTARDAAEAAQTDATDALSTARSNESTLDSVRQLPEFPNFGSRDNKVAKFNGDTLGWEEDASGTGTGSLADGSVTTAKLADNAVTSAKLADNAVIARRLAAGAVVTAKIADAAVTDPKIPNNTVKTRHIAADQVTQGEMAADSVGTPELKNDNVTEAKLSSAVRTKLNESGGLSRSQVDDRIDAVVDDDFILDLGDNSRTTIDRGKVLGVSSTDENNLVLITPSESGGGVASRVLEDLENRVSDIRIVSPATWDTATGTNVGLNIQQALNRNPENLSYSATGTVPSINPGTAIYIYVAIPVRQNVSDWRLNLNNFDISYGHNWTRVGAISTTHTIYRFNTTVGGGGAGEQGTNPAATITLQHHGTGSHTAYSGSFEGDAITGIRDEIDGTSISRALSFPAGSRSEVALRTPADPNSPAQINISNGEFSKTRRLTSAVVTESRGTTFSGTGNIDTAVITVEGLIGVAGAAVDNLVVLKLPDNALIGQDLPMYMQISGPVQIKIYDENDVEITNANRLPRNGNILARYTSESRVLTFRVISGLPTDGGLNQIEVDARINRLVNDEKILDLAKSSRSTADRGKFLGTATGDEDDLTLLEIPNFDVATADVIIANLGQQNLNETDSTKSGLLNSSGAATSRFSYSVVNGQPNSGEQNLRWNPDIDGHFLPTGFIYNSANGLITIPEGDLEN